jgi:hypothetical protein
MNSSLQEHKSILTAKDALDALCSPLQVRKSESHNSSTTQIQYLNSAKHAQSPRPKEKGNFGSVDRKYLKIHVLAPSVSPSIFSYLQAKIRNIWKI